MSVVLDNTDDLLLMSWTSFSGQPKQLQDEVLRFSRLYAAALLGQVANELERESSFSSARKVRAKADSITR